MYGIVVTANSSSVRATSANFKMKHSAKSLFVKSLLAGWALGFFAFFTITTLAQDVSPLNLPVYFEANQNQTEFRASGSGYQFVISPGGVKIALHHTGTIPATAEMQFVGANPGAQIQGGEKMIGKVNYLTGNDPSQWQTGLPTFGNVQVSEIYPGINVIFHVNNRQLEYDFTIAPGADPHAIKIRFDGAKKISLGPDGSLIVKIGSSEVRQPEPEVYQTIGGTRRLIDGGYKILDTRTVAFVVGDYDRSLPLVIDPVLGYLAFFGGSTSATAYVMALDTNKNIYIAGSTFSQQFFTTSAAQTSFGGGTYSGDAFVAKFSYPGKNLIYLTYLGGNSDDAAHSLAVDSAGHAFVTGYTESPNFPTVHALYPTIPTSIIPFANVYFPSAFVSELNPTGTALIYSTYLGGTNENYATAIAVDSSDNAYITGATYSTNFPVTAYAMQKHLACSNNIYFNANAFVTEIASNDSSLVYSTFFGGTNFDVGEGIALSSNNYVYICGYTASTNFPIKNPPANLPNGSHLNGITNQDGYTPFDGFVTKFPPLATQPSSISSLSWSTFLGGTNSDMAYGLALDSAANVYVTGWTSSTNFPVTSTPPGLFSYMTTNGNVNSVATNAFLTKIRFDGSQVLESTVFGGRSIDIGQKVAVDAAGDAFVIGSENSTNFPTWNAFGSLVPTNTSIGGCNDAFTTAFSANWSSVYYSVLLGGNSDTFGYGIALDSSTNAFITGGSDSWNLPSFNAFLFTFNGSYYLNGTYYIDGRNYTGTNDAYLAEIVLSPTVPVISAITPASQTVGPGATVTFSAVTGITNQQILYQWAKNGTNLVTGGRISGATSSTLTITNAQPGDGNTNYSVIIQYYGGSIKLSASLTVLDMPFIITAPTNEVVPVGSNATFTVVASGAALQYLWSTNSATSFLTNGTKFSGISNSTLTVHNAQPADAGTYTVYIFTNLFAGTFTNVSATLTVVTQPIIVTAPTNQSVGAGSAVNFTVVANGVDLSYQWSTNGGTNFLSNGGNISGSTSSTLTITNAQLADAGTYTVFVKSGSYSTTASATLAVGSPSITSFAPASGNIANGLVLSGTNGANNGIYYVLNSTNLAIPLNLWTPVATNQFGSHGQFIFTNPVQFGTPQLFIILKQQ